MTSGTIRWAVEGFSLLWTGLALLAPVTAALGWTHASAWIYRVQAAGCSQQPGHSVWVCGHPMGICARHTAIYAALGISAAVPEMSASLRRIRWRVWMLSACLLPVAADGGLELLHRWAPTMLTRLVTGALAGTGLGLFLALNRAVRSR